ncbi:HsdM family class I SAM-dependent methyltransferase [Crassaminicella indica]|uniref:site-specific DNA-methyltransferase (adenine-specific) n=1 Tax=Crassaminicella indica TaxID=2855394 RepID=A0ABX8RAJ0_9CLOT|nr:N-6 DNA methylase [Crassaminicella indica]QXM05816.1 SAM-dependent methyltransferase [Crassaminicella indica]
MNERITENLVRDILREKGYYDDKIVTVEEQSSNIPRVDKLLSDASKKGKGKGYPEFIITTSKNKSLVVVIECKADIKKHESKERKKYADYAVDGALNYADYLSKDFNVIAIGVSGQNENELKINSYLWAKGSNKYEPLNDDGILTIYDYINIVERNPIIEKKNYFELMKFSKDLHNDMRDYAKLTETEKPILVSGILIALSNQAFLHSYKYISNASDLAHSIVTTIETVVKNSKIPEGKVKNLIQVYSFIETHPELNRGDTLFNIVEKIDKHVKPFMNSYNNIDVIGQFYGEFLRYTGGDKKSLGIVLTPRHITELFAEMANLTPDSVVLDTCCGTGGFLISAMYEMIKKAGNSEEKIKHIKSNNLIGVEQQPNMFALATSNMILRGDGKSNLYLGSCFSFDEQLKSKKPTVGFINPPYSQKGEGLSELDFIKHMLDCLEPNSLGFAIVPMGTAIGTHPLKAEILKKHTLEAVMSMPDDLFYPVGVIPCIMVFRAKVPHNANYESWFGYWKDDGFVKTKNEGRIDLYHRWERIKVKWLDMYFNKKEIPGYSVKKKVTANDEWCAEAYMETDYSDITEEDFENVMKKYMVFKIMNGCDENEDE